MRAAHACPHDAHIHQRFESLRQVTSPAVVRPFFVGCHSAATSGRREARSFRPGRSTRSEQPPQACLRMRVLGADSHSWPHSLHSHQRFTFECWNTSAAVSAPFRVGCQLPTRSGCWEAKSLMPGMRTAPEHRGHPRREPGVVVHSCAHDAHRQMIATCDVANTASGLRVFLGDHSRARSGRLVARSLTPTTRATPAHAGQPLARVRFMTLSCHACPQSEHNHQYFFLLPAVTSEGVSAPLRSGCHVAAAAGATVARSVTPEMGTFPAQAGHPLPAERAQTAACHSCAHVPHRHQRRTLLCTQIAEATTPSLLLGCSSAASSGR